MEYLNEFESEVLATATGDGTDAKPIEKVCAIQKKFGMPKQQRIDDWLELTNKELQSECLKHELPVSDRHIHNIQTLFNYLK